MKPPTHHYRHQQHHSPLQASSGRPAKGNLRRRGRAEPRAGYTDPDAGPPDIVENRAVSAASCCWRAGRLSACSITNCAAAAKCSVKADASARRPSTESV